jgi:hypothetical protein
MPLAIYAGMPTFTYRDLEAWKQGIELVEECYRVTASFPRSELFGLTNGELETYFELAARLGFLSRAEYTSPQPLAPTF